MNKIQVNELGNLFRKAMAKYPEVKVFTSLSNRFGLYRQNTFYLHHFGNRQFDVGQGEMDGSFSFMQSSLHAMIGAAIYMGFKKAILVGCDYVFSPVKNGHFYCDNISNQGAGQCPFTDLFNKVSDQIQLSVMTSRGYKSQVLNSVSYEEYFSCLEKYREYEQIVDEGYLCILKKAVKKGQHGAVLNR